MYVYIWPSTNNYIPYIPRIEPSVLLLLLLLRKTR